MATMFKRPPKVDLDRFKPIKGRVADLYAHMGDHIRQNKTIMAWSGIFGEMAWLTAEITRLGAVLGGVPDADKVRFGKIAAFVRRVGEEQGDAIKNGQFVKVGANVISAMRFLVRCLEAMLVQLVEEAEGLELLDDRMPPEDTDRIHLDLDAGVADEDETGAA